MTPLVFPIAAPVTAGVAEPPMVWLLARKSNRNSCAGKNKMRRQGRLCANDADGLPTTCLS